MKVLNIPTGEKSEFTKNQSDNPQFYDKLVSFAAKIKIRDDTVSHRFRIFICRMFRSKYPGHG